MKLPKQTFRPLGTLVVLLPIKITETAGGIRLPDSVVAEQSHETPRCWVVAAGPDCKLVKRGDEVLVLAQTHAWKVQHKEQELLVINEDKIVGVVEDVAS